MAKRLASYVDHPCVAISLEHMADLNARVHASRTISAVVQLVYLSEFMCPIILFAGSAAIELRATQYVLAFAASCLHCLLLTILVQVPSTPLLILVA